MGTANANAGTQRQVGRGRSGMGLGQFLESGGRSRVLSGGAKRQKSLSVIPDIPILSTHLRRGYRHWWRAGPAMQSCAKYEKFNGEWGPPTPMRGHKGKSDGEEVEWDWHNSRMEGVKSYEGVQ